MMMMRYQSDTDLVNVDWLGEYGSYTFCPRQDKTISALDYD